jgi:hypothetical protein
MLTRDYPNVNESVVVLVDEKGGAVRYSEKLKLSVIVKDAFTFLKR